MTLFGNTVTADTIRKDEVIREEGEPLIQDHWCPKKKGGDLEVDAHTGNTLYAREDGD